MNNAYIINSLNELHSIRRILLVFLSLNKGNWLFRFDSNSAALATTKLFLCGWHPNLKFRLQNILFLLVFFLRGLYSELNIDAILTKLKFCRLLRLRVLNYIINAIAEKPYLTGLNFGSFLVNFRGKTSPNAPKMAPKLRPAVYGFSAQAIINSCKKYVKSPRSNKKQARP